MKSVSTFLALLLVLCLATCALAQDDDEYFEEIVKDNLEVNLYGGLAMPMGGIKDWTSMGASESIIAMGPKTGFTFGAQVGMFLTTNMALGVDLTYNQFGVDSDLPELESSKHRSYALQAYLKNYFFGDGNFAPFLKASAGIVIPKYVTSLDDEALGYKFREQSYDPAFIFGAGAGLFYYTHDYGGLFVEVDYMNGLTDATEATYQGINYEFGENSSTLEIRGGVAVFFGPQ